MVVEWVSGVGSHIRSASTNATRVGLPASTRSPFGHADVVLTAPLSRDVHSSIGFVKEEKVSLRALFDMGAIRAAYVRNDPGAPNSVKTLTYSVLGLIDNAERLGGSRKCF